jgi:hypothetical protein
LSLFQPALGHLYDGLPERALALWVSSIVAVCAIILVVPLLPPPVMLPALLLAPVLVFVAIVRDAMHCARHAGGDCL